MGDHVVENIYSNFLRNKMKKMEKEEDVEVKEEFKVLMEKKGGEKPKIADSELYENILVKNELEDVELVKSESESDGINNSPPELWEEGRPSSLHTYTPPAESSTPPDNKPSIYLPTEGGDDDEKGEGVKGINNDSDGESLQEGNAPYRLMPTWLFYLVSTFTRFLTLCIIAIPSVTPLKKHFPSFIGVLAHA
jgi:hypothetical protein